MVFSSLLFLYAFLPVCFLFYTLSKSITAKNTILLIFSLVFYAWGEPVYVLLLIFMTFCDWLGALKIESAQSEKKKKLYLISTCIVNLGLIGIFKYTGFIVSNIEAISGLEINVGNIPLPIGISFYTFQLLSYVVDVYRKDVPAQKNFSKLLLYASLFYQCIAGPIVRYSDVHREINQRKTNITEVSKGITRFTIGLAKKAVIANTCGALSDQLLVSDALMSSSPATAFTEILSQSVVGLWFGMIFYMLQIYLDFSAYSDMAIGMGLMTGFHFKENFDYPYTAKSVTEFWRKWHISLSSFFRDYVYIPLGGNRKGTFKTYRNLFIVWFLTGLWHGASWNFILWGLFFFLFLVIEKTVLLKILNKIPSFFSHAYLLIIVFFGWVLFRFTDFTYIPVVVKGLFGLNGNAFINFETKTLLISNIIFIVMAIFSVTPVVNNISKALEKCGKGTPPARVYNALNIICPILLLFVATLSLVGDSYNPFLYFQF